MALTAGRLVARMLRAEGVEVVFGIVDGSYFGLCEGLREEGIGYNIITENLENAGFYLKQKKHAPIFDNTAYSTVFNFLFARE